MVSPSVKRSKSGGHPDGCRLNEFFEVPPPCVSVSEKHHARLTGECRRKSTVVSPTRGGGMAFASGLPPFDPEGPPEAIL
jgi:hypothetical protein